MPSRKERKKYDKVDLEDGLESESSAIDGDTITIQLKLPEEGIREIEVSLNTTVDSFRKLVSELTTIEPERQRLIHFGKMLNGNDKTLENFGVKNGDFIHLMPLPKNVTPSRLPSHPDPVNGRHSGPLHEIPGLSMEFMNNLSNEEYYQLVEMNLWRARVRLLSSLMLFYYFLQCMGNLSLWLHPDEMNMRYTENHHPSNLFFIVDLVESMVGMIAAISGMKAASSDNTVYSTLFLRNTLETGFMHFISFVIYSHELLAGKIEMNPKFSYNKPADNPSLEKEALTMGVVFSFMVNFFIWWSIFSIAIKYHQNLVLNFPVNNNVEDDVEEEETQVV